MYLFAVSQPEYVIHGTIIHIVQELETVSPSSAEAPKSEVHEDNDLKKSSTPWHIGIH